MRSASADRTTAARTAHRRSVEIGPVDLVNTLHDKLGAKLLAFIVGKDPSTISRWRQGKPIPDEETLRPLRVAFQVFQLLESAEADPTIRAWFIGMNPQLDDTSPSESLRDGNYREVMAAARAFLAGA